MLQEVCSETSNLEHTKEVVSRSSVVMDEEGNLLSGIVGPKTKKMLYRKHLVLGTGNWPQHSLERANFIINEIPKTLRSEEEIETFITQNYDI